MRCVDVLRSTCNTVGDYQNAQIDMSIAEFVMKGAMPAIGSGASADCMLIHSCSGRRPHASRTSTLSCRRQCARSVVYTLAVHMVKTCPHELWRAGVAADA